MNLKTALVEIKSKLYDALAEASKTELPSGIEQKLKLMTGKKAVNVIQIQSINQNVVLNIQNVIREIDTLEKEMMIPVNSDQVQRACEMFFDQGVSYTDMCKTMKKAYIEYALSKKKNVTEAARFLGLQRQTLSNLKHSLEVKYEY